MRRRLFPLVALAVVSAPLLAEDKANVARLKKELAAAEAKVAELKAQLAKAEGKGTPPEVVQWQDMAKRRRERDPNWEPMAYSDPSWFEDVAYSKCSFVVVKMIDENTTVVRVEKATFYLEASLGKVVADREYRLEGLFAPAGKKEYTPPDGKAVSVPSVRFVSRLPKPNQPVDITPEVVPVKK